MNTIKEAEIQRHKESLNSLNEFNQKICVELGAYKKSIEGLEKVNCFC